MRTSWRQRGLVATVLATIVTAGVMLVVAPGVAHPGVPGPLASVDFVDTWTNDDGTGGDGDDGGPFGSYDAWLLASSADPQQPGAAAVRTDKDVAVCTSSLNAGDPNVIDVVIQNAYPHYVCTFSAVVANGSPLPATVEPAVLEADAGLVLTTETPQLPAVLGPGFEAEAVFALQVLQSAPQSTALHAAISIVATADYGRILVDKVTDPAEDPTPFEFEPSWGDRFTLTDQAPQYDSGLLNPGEYSLEEVDLPENWSLVAASCVVEGQPQAPAMDPSAIFLGPGETVICTFENLKEEVLPPNASLVIVKEARPADDTTFWFDGGALPSFSLQDPSDSFEQFTELEPGTYTITELSAGLGDDWLFDKVECDATDWSAAGQSVTVNLTEGEVAVCTFHNAQELPYTGGSIPTAVGAGGLVALMLGLWLLLARRRRREAEN